MNNTYLNTVDSLPEALSIVDELTDKMKDYSNKYERYTYSITLNFNKEDNEWIVELNIRTKDEQNDVTTPEINVVSRDVL